MFAAAIRQHRIAVLVLVLPLVIAACSGGSSPSPAPTATPPASVAPATSPPAAAADVEATAVGNLGTVLVAGSNGMTVYIFTKDVKDSGKSACSGDCLVTWPPLTVAAGATPAGGDGVTGALGTITREDTGALQVTYNGLPLYFFMGDAKAGDANGVYTNWEAVKP